MTHPFLTVIVAAVAGALALFAVETVAPGLGSATGLVVMGGGLWGAGRTPRVPKGVTGGWIDGAADPGNR